MTRARPTTVAEAHYKQLFSEKYPIEVYIKCAQIMKRVDDCLDGIEVVKPHVKNNVMFHTAMYVACVLLKSPHPQRVRIAGIDMTEVTDDLILECAGTVGKSYNKLGGNDRAAKGPRLVEVLKSQLEEKFGRSIQRRKR